MELVRRVDVYACPTCGELDLSSYRAQRHCDPAQFAGYECKVCGRLFVEEADSCQCHVAGERPADACAACEHPRRWHEMKTNKDWAACLEWGCRCSKYVWEQEEAA